MLIFWQMACFGLSDGFRQISAATELGSLGGTTLSDAALSIIKRNIGEKSKSMSIEDRTQLFNDWATHYDYSVHSTSGFPFDGYEQVLDEVCRLAAAQPRMSVLDLGTGTGNLAKRFAVLGCAVWGVDFSSEMLSEARAKLPQVKFVQTNLLSDWPTELDQRFDRIVSAYVFHEFDLSTKVGLLQRLAQHHLANGGHIVIGDIAFPTVQVRKQAHRRWASLWDEDEHYWAADEAIAVCAQVGLQVSYTQVSICGGVFVVSSSD